MVRFWITIYYVHAASYYESGLQSRCDEVVLFRLRCGHNLLGKCHKWSRSVTCSFCNEDETVQHLLLSCRGYVAARRKVFYCVNNILHNRYGIDLFILMGAVCSPVTASNYHGVAVAVIDFVKTTVKHI